MSHRADSSFFESKRDWSRRKDGILDSYLRPYLAKIAKLNRPILLVDGFAGPGQFDDGEPGSPILICRHAFEAINRSAQVRVLCIEKNAQLFDSLKTNLREFEFAEALSGSFSGHIPKIADLTRSHSVFIYADPYAVVGLDLSGLESVFRAPSESNTSVEVLLNFNAYAFVRGGLSVLRRALPSTVLINDDDSITEWLDNVSAENLDASAGGDWWREVLVHEPDFSRQIQLIVDGVAARMKDWFNEVGFVPIRRVASDELAKYYMVFGSRHPDALELMNDAMFAASQDDYITLDLLAESQARSLILELATNPVKRGTLIKSVIRQEFCRQKSTDIRGHIEALLKEGLLKSSTGRTRINNNVEVWADDVLC